MKKFVVALIICLGAFFAYSQELYQSSDNMLSTYRKDPSDGYSWRQREIKYIFGTDRLTKEKLLSTIWVTDPLIEPQSILVFYKDDVFKIGSRQAGSVIQGKYQILENKLKFYQYKLDTRIENIYGLSGNSDTTIITDSDNLFYKEQLSIGKILYFPFGSERKNGEKVVFDGIKVLITDDRKVMNENVRFRTRPNTEASLIRIYQYSEITEDKIYSIKRGTIVDLIARTIEMQEIDGVIAPWYFIKVFDGYEGFQYGWVFGGFFVEYEKEKESEYWNWIVSEFKPKK